MKKKKMKWLIYAVIIIAILLIVFKLKSNKDELGNQVKMSQRTVDQISVSVETVEYGTLNQNVTATGTLEAAESLTVVSETQGKIVNIFKEKGDRVSVGDVIVKVDDEVISANVLTAEANYAQFEKDIERLTRLSEENAVTKRDLEQTTIGMKKAKADLINAHKALKNTSITAPISGYINNDFVTQGQFLGGGSPVCEIINNEILKLNVFITEYEVFKVELGQEVDIHLTAFPGKKFIGKITSIANKADKAMKFNVEITLQNNNETHLKSGLYAEAIIPVKNEKRLLISKLAIVGSMENPTVYIAENGKAVKRNLIIGLSGGNSIEVLKGLSEKEKLIVSGQLNVKDGDNVKIVN